jgi:microsomal epoxide hydrolase
VAAWLGFGAAAARAATLQQDRYFTTSDGVRLHYIEAGSPRGGSVHTEAVHTIVFVPGWTMPAWIWDRQIAYFATGYRVIAFDPRGQGLSDVPTEGYEPGRRGQDIAELIAQVDAAPVLLVGWSLGVLDSLAYLHTHGDAHIAGLVLVDNSVGEDPPPPPPRRVPYRRPEPYDSRMRSFVRSMFQRSPGPEFLDELTDAALHTPETAAARLLAYPVPRTYWKQAVYSTNKPVLYAVRPGLAGQAANLQAHHPGAESVIFADAGHALFIDDATRFNSVMQAFITQLIWR